VFLVLVLATSDASEAVDPTSTPQPSASAIANADAVTSGPDPEPSPSPSGDLLAKYGPTSDVACPSEGVILDRGSPIQDAVDAAPSGTTFCLEAGVFDVTAPITPRTGDRFIGLFGATLDGSSMPGGPNTGIFRAHNEDIDDVTIRNLVIRNSPSAAIHAFTDHSDRWEISNNEIYGNRVGVIHGSDFQIHHNTIHHNWQYGIGGFRSHGSVISENEFAFNAERSEEFPGDSATSKWALTRDTTVRGNYIHDNYSSGIWFDGENSGVLIEGNRVIGNAGNGIFHEASAQAVIRGNIVARSHRGIFISESRDTEVYHNVIRRTDRAIALFQDGDRIWESELANISVHDNEIVVPATAQSVGEQPLAVSLTCRNLSDAECSVYSTDRGIRFETNRYVVPSSTGAWWLWNGAARTWIDWLAQGQDALGSVIER
jgi:parallel beta-helix repeat protein